MPLRPKQERFCQEYVIDLNGTQAAIRAGYSANCAVVTASQLLSNPNVSARVKELQQTTAEKLGITHEYVLKGLMDVKERCMTAEPVMIWDPEAKAMIESGEYQFDSKGANRSLELLGKHLGMFVDKVDHTTKGKEIKPPFILNVKESTKQAIDEIAEQVARCTQM